MEKFFEKIRPIAAFIGLGLLGLHLILLLIYYIGAGASPFAIVSWVVELALIGTLALAFFTKKEQLLKVVLVLLLAFYAVSLVLGGTNRLGLGEGGDVLGTLLMVFGILGMVSAIAALAVYLLRLALPETFDKPLFKMLVLALVASVVLFSFICSIFVFIEAGKTAAEIVKAGGDAGRMFPTVMYCIDQYIVLPTAFLIGVFVHEGY